MSCFRAPSLNALAGDVGAARAPPMLRSLKKDAEKATKNYLVFVWKT
jgi:hypothetical protein